MQIKHFISAAVLAAAMPLSAMAGSENKVDELVDSLQLDDKRAEQVREIMNDYHEQKKEIKKVAHDQKKLLKDLKKQRLSTVLSENEMEQLEAVVKEKMERYKEKHKNWKKKHDE